MKNTLFLLGLGVFVALAPAHATLIGPYPGLDALVKEADAIAVVRLDSAPSHEGINGNSKARCTVLQTLKGHLKAHGRVQIGLNDAVSVGPSNLTRLMFLHSSKPTGGAATYDIILREGADLPMAPQEYETKPAGNTLKAQIQTLIRRYQTVRNAQIKLEDELLDKSLAE